MSNYPKDEDIKAKWTAYHKAFIILPTIVIWVWFISLNSFISPSTINKLLSLIGLNIDIIGVIIASLKAPYYGLFVDGGKIEFKRQQVEHESFKRGMFIVVVGLFFQALGLLV